MSLFDKLFGRKTSAKSEKKEETVKTEESKPKKEKKLTAKEQATLNNEPYINVVNMEVNPEDINSGAFELDFNDKFVLNLIKAGYKIRDDDTETQIVDRWFQTVCRNIALELYEQQQADPDNRYRNEMRVVRSKDLGDGRSEVS